jgi:ABC-type lipoprotein release transport system permease subunit
MLFELAPRDPVTLTTAAFVLIGSAALASWVPSRRAARVQPSIALRAD